MSATGAPVEFTVTPEWLLDSRYDLKRLPFRTGSPSAAARGVLSLRRRKLGEKAWEWDLDLGVRVGAAVVRQILVGPSCWCGARGYTHHRCVFRFEPLWTRAQEAFGLDGLEVTWNVFHAWKQFQQDGDRAALQQRVEQIKRQMRPLLEWGSTGKRQRHVRALAKNVLKLWGRLVDVRRGAGRRADKQRRRARLRAAVIYRKLSLGSRSQGGERTIERLLSIDQTCRLQRRSLYGYLAEFLTARARGDPLPALA